MIPELLADLDDEPEVPLHGAHPSRAQRARTALLWRGDVRAEHPSWNDLGFDPDRLPARGPCVTGKLRWKGLRPR